MESRKIPIRSAETDSSPADETEAAPFHVVDRRHFIDPDDSSLDDGQTAPQPRYPSYVEELLARTDETERRFRVKAAEFEQEAARMKQRLEADYERRLELSRQALLLPFLEVLDNLERAVQAAPPGGSHDENLLKGVRMTADLFLSRLRSQGIEPIEVLDRPFDPNECQAIGVVAVAEPELDGLVVEEVLRGYRMGENLLRPAQVRVGQFRQDAAAGV